jgi:hypothetical protein
VENLTEKILSRCEDLELGFPGLIPQQLRDLPDTDVQVLAEEVDYRARGASDEEVRRRYNNLDRIIKDDLDRRAVQRARERVQHLSSLSRQTGRETCECGHAHPSGANFYVTATDGKKVVPLSGPYPTHAEAAAMVDEVREKALEVDPGAAFASFGTTAMKASYSKRGVLD